MSQVLIFGDSIAYGAWDKEGGWVQRLRKYIDEKVIVSKPQFYCMVYNLSIDGDSTEEVLERVENETRKRLLEEETVFIFAVGINDSCFVKNTEEFLTPFEEFKNNVQKLISGAKKFSAKIIFIGLTPVDEKKTNPYFASTTGKSYRNEFIEKYDKIIKDICAKNKIHFIELFEQFKKVDYKKLLEDGLHPNSKGHKIIFETVKKFLIENKII
ncbi:hypothetical protein KKG29_00440 [Patescibacteria group bacterium]|nr:hypothetical protein [Patescibacteria group bacterium]MBU3999636.1 hypothetical protein [Patescibacteria group bacterium]MBU4056711.1 hypothetical protein [Patescibacteria group bacterium]